jgi:hypothetical protein
LQKKPINPQLHQMTISKSKAAILTLVARVTQSEQARAVLFTKTKGINMSKTASLL